MEEHCHWQAKALRVLRYKYRVQASYANSFTPFLTRVRFPGLCDAYHTQFAASLLSTELHKKTFINRMIFSNCYYGNCVFMYPLCILYIFVLVFLLSINIQLCITRLTWFFFIYITIIIIIIIIIPQTSSSTVKWRHEWLTQSHKRNINNVVKFESSPLIYSNQF